MDRFGLFLIILHDVDRISVVRQLQDFEYPYVSLKELSLTSNGRIVIRKCVWNMDLETDIINDPVGMDLLYEQIVREIDLRWIMVKDDARQNRLEQLIKRQAKKETLQLARTLDYYGYIHIFDKSICNIPEKDSEILVSTGNFEILFRSVINVEEVLYKFSLTRIKGWKICTVIDDDGRGGSGGDTNHRQSYDRPYSATLTFEYLNPGTKTLESVEISNRYTDQIILLSMSLKSMAEEYVYHKGSVKSLAGGSHYESLNDSNSRGKGGHHLNIYKTSMLYSKEIGDDDL